MDNAKLHELEGHADDLPPYEAVASTAQLAYDTIVTGTYSNDSNSFPYGI